MLRLTTLLLLGLTAQQAPTNTALIVGRVLDQTDGKPIGGAVVELVPETPAGVAAPGGPPRRQMTDALGRFVFRELPGGVYSVRARTGGNGYGPSGFIVTGVGSPIAAYVAGGFGQRRPGGPLESITLADGQNIPHVVIRLWRGGAISGTVLDDLGDPVVDSIIGAVQMSTDGRLIDGPTTRTDDRGRYRLSALLPGRYIVFVPQTIAAISAELADTASKRIADLESARNPGASVPPAPPMAELVGLRVGRSIVNTSPLFTNASGTLAPRRDGDAVFVFQTTFHPQATTLATATTLELGTAEDKAGVDVVLQPVRAAAVSGTVIDQGAPASGVRLRMMPSGAAPEAALFETATTATDALGRFTFPVVPVGNYTIASSIPTPTVPAQGTPVQHSVAHPGGVGTWLSESVSVGPDGVGGLLFSLKNSYTLKAQVEFVGASPHPTDQQMARLMVGLRSVRPRGRIEPGNGGAQGPLTPAGGLTLAGISPGRYTIRMLASPPGPLWRLQSVTVGGREVDELPIDINEDLDDVRIVLTDRPAGVGGRVTFTDPAGGTPAVFLFPADRRLWPDARVLTRRFRLVRTSPAGEFSLTDIPPGDYLAVSVLDDLAGSFPDETFLTKLAPLANPLRIESGNRASLALTIKTLVKQP